MLYSLLPAIFIPHDQSVGVDKNLAYIALLIKVALISATNLILSELCFFNQKYRGIPR